ncbi:protein lethal(2)essential for life-like [Schistocerca gregaria]|uniref:protein lethal(2)essential for life-like n=1 Tax=Schistocerca gregaria TaxID=7010 RepID=UPI00211F375F|nr:protein lethal(2)essential for life-like [Schistocerca gregaria]
MPRFYKTYPTQTMQGLLRHKTTLALLRGTVEHQTFRTLTTISSIKPVVDVVFVEEQHEEQQVEKCFISKQFTRCYMIPNRIEPEAITSGLSADSFLIIAAPRKQLPSASMCE